MYAIRSYYAGVTILTYGLRDEDTAKVLSKTFNLETKSWKIKADIEGEIVEYEHPLFHQFIPIMSAGVLLVVKRLGFDIQKASKEFVNFTAYETMGQLLEIKKESGNFFFYNQSRRGGGINSIVSSFKDLENFDVKGKVVALFGSMSIKESYNFV